MDELPTTPPRVMIECRHLVTFQMGYRISCGECGAVWALPVSQAEKDAADASWNRRIERALEYQQMPWWRRWLEVFNLRDLWEDITG